MKQCLLDHHPILSFLLLWLKPPPSVTPVIADNSGLGQGKESGGDKKPNYEYILKVEARFPDVKFEQKRIMLKMLARSTGELLKEYAKILIEYYQA